MGATLILLEGKPGTGKSTAWEHIPHNEACIIKPNAKPLPFKGSKAKYNDQNKNVIVTNQITQLPSILKNISEKMKHVKYVLIDDFTHYFNARVMDKTFISRKSGNDAFAKWNEFGADVFASLTGTTETLREDLYIIINHHTEIKEDGTVGFKTSGKLLDNVIDAPSYFTYIFHTDILRSENGVEYRLLTNSDGMKEAKTPRGCFTDLYIPNDMKLIVDTIEKYEKGE